jgi:dolichol-phosphate mannosyltransferase
MSAAEPAANTTAEGNVPPAISIVMPAYNEEAVIERTITELAQALDREAIDYEIIAVNDASKDGTWAVLQTLAATLPRLRCITNAGPNGYGYAIRAGLAVYRGDAMVIVTADGSDSPRDVVAYFRAIERGADCAFGSRFVKGATVSRYPRFKLLVNRLANACVSRLLGTRYDDFTNGFKCYRRHVIDAMLPIVSGQFNITIELAVKAVQGGWTYEVCPTDWTEREAGTSSFKLFRLIGPYTASLVYCLTLNYLRGGNPRRAAGSPSRT